ncbi:capsular polysaccharide biosynthesis protein [Thioclava sp. GXIMD4215]|uniref:capsular polysaccharide biosynthesis protein n=1 Tax=Thioclava sp. GXIMD4215 TaxID=3131928 RepID=UPI00324E5242
MPLSDAEDMAAGVPRRLFFYNGGFLRQPRLRHILKAAGHSLHLGLPRAEDGVVVWGRSPYANRGEAVAARTGATLIRLEDAFLRSVRTGRAGEAPLGLIIDPVGVHFDGARPSRIERLLQKAALDDGALLARARQGIARLKALDLSKYNDFDIALPPPAPGYVLVIDQTRGDASITHGAASARTFREMLAVARIENPKARILIKTHPETRAGFRAGHYSAADGDALTEIVTAPHSPWALLEGAIAVYTVSSLMGYEAILAGHRPRVFGQPFYAGWGLSQDEAPPPRRERRLTRAQIFAVSHLLAPTWFDPCRARLCSFEEAVDQLAAQTRAYREDGHGYAMTGMSRWKHKHLRRFYGGYGPVRFGSGSGAVSGSGAGQPVHWASKPDRPTGAWRMEDGFLRSRGLGAKLTPPLSLVTDRQGIYYDPTTPSDLEALIAQPLPDHDRLRIERLLRDIRKARLSKYNLAGTAPALPRGHRILVPGQVEDDASIRMGSPETGSNLALLTRARAENPDAVIIYKPHPDVEAGLRKGSVPADDLARLADLVCQKTDGIALIEACDEVWTMTSLMGFEALLRGKPVTCLGMPFYAGWGLTRDLMPQPPRRQARPDLWQLAHAALIAYPRYMDPLTGLPCPPEIAVERLAQPLRTGLSLRLLSRLQDLAKPVRR